MTGAQLWTTVDIARELHLTSTAAARSKIRRWRQRGIHLDVEIDPLSGVKRYKPDQIRSAAQKDPGRGARTDLTTSPDSTTETEGRQT